VLSIPKYIFAEKIAISLSTLRGWQRQYRQDLAKLGQQQNDKVFNYLTVLYLCDKQVIDPSEFYPTVSQTELQEHYNKINTLLYEK